MELAWRDRGFRWFTNEAGHRCLLIGDRLLRMIIDPTFERVAKPGSLLEVFKNHGSADFGIAGQEVEPIRPEYRPNITSPDSVGFLIEIYRRRKLTDLATFLMQWRDQLKRDDRSVYPSESCPVIAKERVGY